MIPAAFTAVGDVEVLPAVAIEIGHRDGRAHRGHLRHDVLELTVESRCLVDGVDANPLADFVEAESVTCQRSRRSRAARCRCWRTIG